MQNTANKAAQLHYGKCRISQPLLCLLFYMNTISSIWVFCSVPTVALAIHECTCLANKTKMILGLRGRGLHMFERNSEDIARY